MGKGARIKRQKEQRAREKEITAKRQKSPFKCVNCGCGLVNGEIVTVLKKKATGFVERLKQLVRPTAPIAQDMACRYCAEHGKVNMESYASAVQSVLYGPEEL